MKGEQLTKPHMKQRTKSGLATILLLAIALLSVFFILSKNKGNNSFEITRNGSQNNSPTKNSQTEQKETAEDTAEKEPEKTEEKDWSEMIQKYKGKEIIRVNTEQKAVALTFDAGANADGVEPILKILKENDIQGTFFLTGKFIERYPDKVKEIIATGGDIGNHTYDHPYLTHLTSEQITEKIQGAENALAKLDTKFQPFLRSPYGDRNETTLNTISEAGYINIRWTVDSLGWKGTSGGQTKDSVRDKVLKSSAPGAIIMMHLGSNPDDKTHLDSAALPEIIAALKKDGYEFVTLSKLLDLEK